MKEKKTNETLRIELYKKCGKYFKEKDFSSADKCPSPNIGNGFNQDGRKPIIVIAPFFSTTEKDAGKIMKDFLDGLNDENLLWENVCFHYFFPHPIRMTYQDFLDAYDLFIRPKGITQEKFLNDLLSQNICNKLSFEGREIFKKISKVDYLPKNIDYKFVQNAADYLVEANKAFKRRIFDEYYMRNNYIEEQLLGVKCLKTVVDVVQPYRIVFTDRKTKNLVELAFGNEKSFEKHVERIGTRIRGKANQIKDFEAFLKMDSAQKSVERYRQYVKDWYKQARDWDLMAYIEEREEENGKENWVLSETLRTYLSNIDCKMDALDGLKSSLEKDVPARRLMQPSINKPKANREGALFETLKMDFGTVLKKMNLYEKYESEFESRIWMEAEELVDKLQEENSADENITDADIDTIVSGLFFEKFGPKFELWKHFIENLKTNESALETFLAEFQNVVALRNEKLPPIAELPNCPPEEDRNERLKQGLKSENRIHRLSDLDGWTNVLGKRIKDLKNFVMRGVEKETCLELIAGVQGAQNEIAEIVKKMKELGDAREVTEEPVKEKPSARESQTRKEEKRSILEEKIKKK